MKKVLGALMMFTVLIMGFSTKAFAASEPEIRFTVDGKVEKGEKITVNVMANDVVNLYAVSVDYIYNPEFLKVNSIESDGLIKESNLNLMEPGGQTDKDGNRASYQMTFTGKVEGVSGSGAIVKIEAEVLKDFEIELTEENMKIKLVKVDENYNVDRMSFVFNSLESEENTSGGNTDEIGSPDEGSDAENSGNESETSSEENTSTETGNGNIDENKSGKPFNR